MALSSGVSNHYGAVFHLFSHAFFKALLFLTAGCVYHTIPEVHSFKLGGVTNLLPLSYSFILIGSLCLTGLPNISGYYSKEYILSTGKI